MKDIKKILNIEALETKLVFANTPTYLYKNFQRDNSVIKISTLLTFSELKKSFDEAMQLEKKELDDLVLIYAILIALTHKPNLEVQKFFNDLAEVNLKWASDIKEIYQSKIKVTNSAHYELEYQSDLSAKSNYTDSSEDLLIVNS